MPQRILGIDIGSWSAKAVLVESSFRGFKVEEVHEVPIGAGDDSTKTERQVAALELLLEYGALRAVHRYRGLCDERGHDGARAVVAERPDLVRPHRHRTDRMFLRGHGVAQDAAHPRTGGGWGEDRPPIAGLREVVDDELRPRHALVHGPRGLAWARRAPRAAWSGNWPKSPGAARLTAS